LFTGPEIAPGGITKDVAMRERSVFLLKVADIANRERSGRAKNGAAVSVWEVESPWKRLH
jgi:hypothetical protein